MPSEVNRKVIISTIGTSLLTNQINRSDSQEKNWYSWLRDVANEKQVEDSITQIIEILKDRAIKNLENLEVDKIRRASAELNGIYGIYSNQIDQGKEDIHFLIATDTCQGKTTAEIVNTFLVQQGIVNTSIYTPRDLSTASTRNFAEGIDDLIVWLEKDVSPLKSNYKIYFNLVGSFKSLQGYLNTIGMFYADEIIYIFEGQDSELIKIPRLPIAVDKKVIKPHVTSMALLDTGMGLSKEESAEIPESLIADVDGLKTFSTWGQLVWNQCKQELLTSNLLEFPYLQYKDSFREDWKKIDQAKEKIELQETLAKVSGLLLNNSGNIAALKQDGGLQYDKYTNKGNIDHFRVTQGLRISCHYQDGFLHLHRYGKEEKVNKNPY